MSAVFVTLNLFATHYFGLDDRNRWFFEENRKFPKQCMARDMRVFASSLGGSTTDGENVLLICKSRFACVLPS